MMWKKDSDEQTSGPRVTPTTSAPVPPKPAPVERPAHSNASGERATIGPSIRIRGDVSGDEDLLVQGQIEGSVDLTQHSVTIGAEGRVRANVSGRSVVVEGEVNGDLQGLEQVILRRSAKVQGNITSPRVIIEDGASFRGGIDMGGDAQVRPARPAPGPIPVATTSGGSSEGLGEKAAKA